MRYRIGYIVTKSRIRDREEILCAILEAAQKGKTQTRIMYQTYLNYNQIKEYLRLLQKVDLISYDSATQLYTPTDKGLEFIKKSNAISKLLNNR
jgi:predicted transcriptional regulator